MVQGWVLLVFESRGMALLVGTSIINHYDMSSWAVIVGHNNMSECEIRVISRFEIWYVVFSVFL